MSCARKTINADTFTAKDGTVLMVEIEVYDRSIVDWFPTFKEYISLPRFFRLHLHLQAARASIHHDLGWHCFQVKGGMNETEWHENMRYRKICQEYNSNKSKLASLRSMKVVNSHESKASEEPLVSWSLKLEPLKITKKWTCFFRVFGCIWSPQHPIWHHFNTHFNTVSLVYKMRPTWCNSCQGVATFRWIVASRSPI